MNIVYGGSFNPPTKAHVGIVNYLLNVYHNANVIVVPVGNTYNKSSLVSFKHRYKMLGDIFDSNKRVIVSDIENVDQYKGTFNTLKALNEMYKDLLLVVGSDNLYELDKWIEYENLLKNYPLIIIKRNKDDVDLLMDKYKHLHPNYQVIEYNNNISSTLIRNNIEKNKDSLEEVTYEYIIKNKLYEVK
ncbi:MAG: nicotinate (nicotinamide) nucleotide adenylyltransferase [Acholeplasma sp.]|nr:nicotinate (nicotinamide) nucleotide adenylyltransferase [Acholeplasma sp.]